MNREIKFRAMYSSPEGFKWAHGLLAYMDSEVIQIFTRERNDQKNTDVFNCIPGTEGQFTGIQDKNGREIYEGDLIREVYEASGTMPCATFASPVIFEDASFCLDDHTPLHELIDMKDHDWCVIGNIHENPELLTQANNEHA